jgi:diguanylate cyclase (GGDEF)-like protein
MGLARGQVISLDEKEIFLIGRSNENDIKVDDVGVSRVHCRVVHRTDGYHIEDLGSTNGTVLNGSSVGSALLRSGDRIQLGPAATLQFVLLDDAEDTVARRSFDTATRDSLTRAYNRRYFAERLACEIAHTERHGTPLSVMLLDLDHFKSINDSAGHSAGDTVLRAVVDEVVRSVRVEDVVTRYGGEELAVLVRSTTRQDASRLAERIRQRIEALRVTVGTHAIEVTVSIGVGELAECRKGASGEEVIALAERRQRRAKLLGRNRVCSE